jgi:hypothetical protein
MNIKPSIGHSSVLKATLNQFVHNPMMMSINRGKKPAMITQKQGMRLQHTVAQINPVGCDELWPRKDNRLHVSIRAPGVRMAMIRRPDIAGLL